VKDVGSFAKMAESVAHQSITQLEGRVALLEEKLLRGRKGECTCVLIGSVAAQLQVSRSACGWVKA
jgi:hypothetical protein